MAKKENTAQIAERLVAPILLERGLRLWDVRFEKEGGSWYLRYFIDKPGGVDIQDCEAVSRAVEKRLDEEDPIEQSYILEVGSPGIEREFTKSWQFQEYLGETVRVKLIRPAEGRREFEGILVSWEDGTVTIRLDGETEMTFLQKEAAFVRLSAQIDMGGLNA